MPLTAKGKKIMGAMVGEYGAKKGRQVFYASRNAGKIKGVDRSRTLRGALSGHRPPAARTLVS